MAIANPRLILALRATAGRLEVLGTPYRWTHMGMCNCGQLAQTVTRLSKEEIHRMALQKAGDWGRQAVDHCPTSGYPMDHVISQLMELGLSEVDIDRLERLADREVLRRLPPTTRHLDKRSRDHAVLYMRAWADLLEQEWLRGQDELEAPELPVAAGG